MAQEQDIALSDGRTAHVYDSGGPGGATGAAIPTGMRAGTGAGSGAVTGTGVGLGTGPGKGTGAGEGAGAGDAVAVPAVAVLAVAVPTVVWFHGSPQTGAFLDPVLSAAQERGLRLVSYGRPSYGGSTSLPGRSVASAAADVEQIADALGLDRFAAIASSGGGPHALACAALLPGRVTGVVLLGGIAPRTDDYDWLDGMADPSGLRAALAGRAARVEHARTAEFDPASFIPADYEALGGTWASLVADVGRANDDGPDGLIDDDLAYVAPWGFDVADIAVPVLLVQGDEDRVVPPAHARWMADRIPGAELRMLRGAGHITVLDAIPAALDWLCALAN